MYNVFQGAFAMFYKRNGDYTLGYTTSIGFWLEKNTHYCYFALNLCQNYYLLTLVVKLFDCFSQFKPNYCFFELNCRDKS